MQISREELAWAAGFFDGEGCFRTAVSRARVTLQVCITQVDRRPLDRFQRAVGDIGAIYGPTERSGANEQPQYQFRINRFEWSQAMAAMLWPFLSEPKREQVSAAVVLYRAEGKDSLPMRLRQRCRRGHPVERFVLTSEGRVRCLECSRVGHYERLGLPVPPLGRGRAQERPSWISLRHSAPRVPSS